MSRATIVALSLETSAAWQTMTCSHPRYLSTRKSRIRGERSACANSAKTQPFTESLWRIRASWIIRNSKLCSRDLRWYVPRSKSRMPTRAICLYSVLRASQSRSGPSSWLSAPWSPLFAPLSLLASVSPKMLACRWSMLLWKFCFSLTSSACSLCNTKTLRSRESFVTSNWLQSDT